MNIEQFQKKYHDYSTENEMEAISDTLKLNSILTDGKVTHVKIGDKYCLMEVGAASFIKKNGII